jgi:hypothetical protein
MRRVPALLGLAGATIGAATASLVLASREEVTPRVLALTGIALVAATLGLFLVRPR